MTYTVHLDIPLEDAEKEWLLILYRKQLRSRLITLIISIVVFFLLGIVHYYITLVADADFSRTAYEQQIAEGISGIYSAIALRLSVAISVPLLVFLVNYYRNVRPYKLDAISGLKHIKPFKVARKEYYPITRQYFITLAEYPRKKYEIDRHTFDNCMEDTEIQLPQATRSKHIFSLADLPYSF